MEFLMGILVGVIFRLYKNQQRMKEELAKMQWQLIELPRLWRKEAQRMDERRAKILQDL